MQKCRPRHWALGPSPEVSLRSPFCPSRCPRGGSVVPPGVPRGPPRPSRPRPVPPASLRGKVLSLGGVPPTIRLDWMVSPTLSPKERVSPLSWPFQVCIRPSNYCPLLVPLVVHAPPYIPVFPCRFDLHPCYMLPFNSTRM